jgi:prepilin-type N-terminal cleavage/methylation domain-containing protein
MHSRKFNITGFTLIEVLIALTVASVCIISVTGLFPTAFRNLNNNREAISIVKYAEQVMDDVLSNNEFVSRNKFNYSVPKDFPKDKSGRPMGEIVVWGKAPEPSNAPTFQIVYVEVTLRRPNSTKRTYTLTGAVMPQ